MNKAKKIVLNLLLVLTLTACSLPGLGSDAKQDIVIAGGNTTERQILSEIAKQMIDYHLPEVKTDLINNLGSTLLILQTLTGQDTNISGSMYTGTSLTGELGKEPITEPKEAMEAVVEGYFEKYDMIWFPSYGFENSYAFMMAKDKADKLNIRKVSDLQAQADTLRAGVDTAWIDRKGDGYQAFKDTYGFDFKQVLPMEIGLVYDAVSSNEMDIVLGYSTDGRIQAYDLVVLEDDLQLFPPYDASPLLTADVLIQYPELESIMLRLAGEINSETMQLLNRKSDEEKIEPQVVAREFLEENNYFVDKPSEKLNDDPQYEEIVEVLNQRRKERAKDE